MAHPGGNVRNTHARQVQKFIVWGDVVSSSRSRKARNRKKTQKQPPHSQGVLPGLEDGRRSRRSGDESSLFRRPVFWAGAYIALFFFCGGMFCAQPRGSFYEPNVKREAAVLHDKVSAARDLNSAIRANVQPVVRFGPYDVTVANTSVADVSVTENGEGGVLSILLRGAAHVDNLVENNVRYIDSYFDFAETIRINAPNGVVVNDTIDLPVTLVTATSPLVDRKPGKAEPPLSVMFKPLGGDSKHADSQGILTVNIGLANRLARLAAAILGDPSQASKYPLRMFYLSAVTVTTLGLGDITPVSTTARMLVGGEAAFGVLIVGFFLNALAQRMRDR